MGIVVRWGSYFTPNREKMWGWLIRYDAVDGYDADEYWMLEVDVVKYVIAESSAYETGDDQDSSTGE